jgi:hypothetical protein
MGSLEDFMVFFYSNDQMIPEENQLGIVTGTSATQKIDYWVSQST